MTRRQHAELLLQREPAGAQPELRHHGAPGDEGHEAEREQPEQRLAAEQQRGADADQDGEQHEADQAGVEDHAHALDVEHAAGDQLAGVHAVVEAEAQALQLLVVRQAQLVGDALADRLALVVVPHREQAAQHAGAEQQGGGVPERGARGDLVAAGQQALRGIDRLAEIAAGSGAERARRRSWSPPRSPCPGGSAAPCASTRRRIPKSESSDAGGVLRLRPGRDRTGGVHGRPGRAMGEPL